jgi:hypothetical protein
MPGVIFLDETDRVVGFAKSASYTDAPDPSDPRQVLVESPFPASNMMSIYDRSAGTYTADEITDAYHNPPPREPEQPAEEPAP